MDQHINLPGYLNRHNPAKQFDTVLYRADHVIQSDELNETQSLLQARIRGVADVLLADGAVIRDARIVVNPVTGATTCESGALYVDGTVRGVPPATLTIAVAGIVIVGVYLQTHILTELDDPSLRNRATNTRGFDKPGAARLQKLLTWGVAGDSQAGDFYPVYTVEDGVVRIKEPPPQLDGVTQALARYDRDSSGGSYVVSGLNVAASDDLASGEQVYTVSEGRARVNGFAVELPTSRRLVHTATPDLRYIENEPHQSTGSAAQRIQFDATPAANIVRVVITAQKTIDVAHGGFTGALDPLEDSSVLSVLSVKQGNTVYAKDVDWKLTAQQIDWSLPGAEPAPGSTYTVTYQYLATVAVTDVDANGFTVTGAIAGTAVLVSYNRMLPRIDRLCMDANGAMVWLTGVAAERNPRAPVAPANLLPLSSVLQSWSGRRQIIHDAVRVVAMASLEAYSRRLDYLTELLAQQRLESSIQLMEAGAKRGLFVDAFLSDSMRDQGISQNGAIFNGELTLPVASTALVLPDDIRAPAALPFVMVPVLEQTLRTGAMKVNPYQAFDLLPADVQLFPAIDRWIDSETIWTSPATQNITENRHDSNTVFTIDPHLAGSTGTTLVEYQSSSDTTRLLSSASKPAEFLRPITVRFSISGFGAGESVSQVKFDGISLQAANQVQAGDILNGEFTIPAKVPAGNKRVEFFGSGGKFAVAIYSGSGIVVSNVEQVLTTQKSGWITYKTSYVRVDPLAQTFSLTSTRQITGIDLWFTARGNSRLAIQIRETTTGIPNQNVLAQSRLDAASVQIDGSSTRIAFEQPVLLHAAVEYAIVILCDDASTAVAIAELGKYDAQRGLWITGQPYTVGVLLSSSNASTWTAHQDRDLAFRLLAADYGNSSRTIALGGIDLLNVTDLMLLSLVEIPSAQTRVVYQLALPDGLSLTVDDGQPIRLPAPLSGRFNVSARLNGSTEVSPVLHPGTTLVAGKLSPEALYVSRLLPAGQGVRVRIVVDSRLPAGTSLNVAIAPETAGNTSAMYADVPFLGNREVGAGWMELTYELTGVRADRIRARLVLAGNSASRPRLRNLRIMVL